MAEDIVRFKDFSTSPEPVVWRSNPDTFECLPDIALDVLTELASLKSAAGDAADDRRAQMQRIHDFFDYVMTPDSAALFRKRTAIPTAEAPNPRPIGMKTVTDVMNWLMEVYGLRPTAPSSESADGSEEDVESSTGGAFSTE